MKRSLRNCLLTVAAAGLTALPYCAWQFSPPQSLVTTTGDRRPAAFSRDSTSLAVAMAAPWFFDPAKVVGPVRLCRSDNLVSKLHPIDLPNDYGEDAGGETRLFNTPIVNAEFSPRGGLLALLQEDQIGPNSHNNWSRLLIYNVESRWLRKSIYFPVVPHRIFNPHWRRGEPQFFSADGESLIFSEYHDSESLTSDGDFRVRVWDMSENRDRFLLNNAYAPVLSGDSRLLAVVNDLPYYRCQLALHDAVSGTLLRTLEKPDGLQLQRGLWKRDKPYSFSQDGTYLAVPLEPDNTLSGRTYSQGGQYWTGVFDVATGRHVFLVPEVTAFFVDGPALVTRRGDRTVFRAQGTWKELRSMALDESLEKLPGSAAVINARSDFETGFRITIINALTGERSIPLHSNDHSAEIVVSPRGDRLALTESVWEGGFLTPRRATTRFAVYNLPLQKSERWLWLALGVDAFILFCTAVVCVIARWRRNAAVTATLAK